MEFIKDHYRHCKAILVMPASTVLMQKAQVPPKLSSGKADPGLFLGGAAENFAAFIQGIARHRHPERETDPPAV
ncbi:hypothetical protein D3C85_1434510 [compost metagenome]